MRCRIFFSSFLILLFCIGGAGAEAPKEIHKGCATCHTEPDFKAIKAKVSETCLTCHPASLGRDHSIGVVPKIIPEDLPLGEGNKVTCITCHDPHGKGVAAKLLRKDFNSLCISCHKK
ncbi:MAG: cytochrome c3 family protein [Nitrospirae bacterium]|nr:cytochrome c3 family protein [Nitrospirota bacterium]